MKNKRKIYITIIIVFLMSSMFLISYLFERKIEKENENLQYNQFLEKISIIVNGIEYDKIEENSTLDIYEVLKDDKIVALISINSGNGLTDKYLIGISFVKNEKNEWIIYNYKFIEYGEKDKNYVLAVEENTDLRNKIINNNIEDNIEKEIVSGATISSNELYNALNSSIEKIKGNKKYE